MAQTLIKSGTAICFADFANDFDPTAANDLRNGNVTEVQLQTASVADGSAVNADKIDFGSLRPGSYSVMAAIEFAASVVAGNTVDMYWAPSTQSGDGTANPGGVDGTDGAYTGTTGSTVAESVLQLLPIGSFTVTDDATTAVQMAFVGFLAPPARYGTLVLVNNAGVALHSDDIEIHVLFEPLIPDSQ